MAEGAGQSLFEGRTDAAELDAEVMGGRMVRLHDIGALLKKEVKAHLKNVDVKYIDAKYLVEVSFI